MTSIEGDPPSASHVENRHRKLSVRSAALFSIAAFGYPIVANIVSTFQLESRVLSIPFRIGVALYSLWLIRMSGRLKPNGWRKLMLVIWLFYVVRLLHDWLIADLDGADYALQFFIVGCAMPAVALMKAQAFDRRKFAVMGFVVASLGSLMSLLTAMFGNADVQDATAASGRLSLSALDPVSLGHLATSAILCGVALWPGARGRVKLLLAVTILPLCWCLILTGSKGPALALVFAAGLWAIRNGQGWRMAMIMVPLLAGLLLSEDNPLAARLSVSQEDESTVDRLVVMSDSVEQIAGSPILGSAFVELNSGYYPHNVFLESGLAMGVPGALLFLALMVYGALRAWKTLKTEQALLGLLFFQGLFAASTSGAIFGAITLWLPLAMLTGRLAVDEPPRLRAVKKVAGARKPLASMGLEGPLQP